MKTVTTAFMNIAVCINLVPDTASRVNVRDGVIETESLNMVLNTYDEYALEEAVRLKEQQNGVVVTAFSAGGKDRYDVLRKALAMGADQACLVENTNSDDSLSVAACLNKAMRSHYGGCPDMVLCGRESSDCNRAQVPLMLSEMLGAAALGAVTKLSMQDGGLSVCREIEGGVEEFFIALPAVISAEKGLNIPRKTNIKAVLKARKQPVLHIDGSVEANPGVLYTDFLPVSRERVCTMAETEQELVRMLQEERRVL